MKKKRDIIDHVAAATGIARADVGKVVDAAFAFLRQSALAGDDVSHPSLGRIRVKAGAAGEGGEGKTRYRYLPDPKADKAGGGRTGTGKGARAGRARKRPPASP
jgi:nucleoid DNA-binding protein